MLRPSYCRIRRQRCVFISTFCLFIYVTVVITMHTRLNRFNFETSSLIYATESNETLGERNGTALPHRPFPRHSSLSDANLLGAALRHLQGDIVSNRRHRSIAFPSVSGCPVLHRSHLSSVSFQPLGVDFLYTAYIDDRLRTTYIRVMALIQRRIDNRPMPQFHLRLLGPSSNRSVLQLDDPAELYEMCENHGQDYGGWIVSWPLTHRRSMARRLKACRVEVVVSEGSSGKSIVDRVVLPLFKMSYRKSDEKQDQSLLSSDFSFHTKIADGRDDDGGGGDGDRSGKSRSNSDENVRKIMVDDRSDFAVCVPPLFGEVTAATLIQFVEVTRLLGADHFVFYVIGERQHAIRQSNSSSSSNAPVQAVSRSIRAVLDHYVDLGVATAVSWELPEVAIDAVWYNGQLIAVNDCLYRTAHAFRHVAFNDIDEFIVPRAGIVNWKQMLDNLQRLSSDDDVLSSSSLAAVWVRLRHLIASAWPLGPRDVVSTKMTSSKSALSDNLPCGYSFQSAFFSPVSEPLELSIPDFIPSYDLSVSTIRSQLSRVRTKVLVRPEAVFEIGIHHISRPLLTLPGASENASSLPLLPTILSSASKDATVRDRIATEVVSVPPRVGLVHHYRPCLMKYDSNMDCSRSAFVVDDALERTAVNLPELESRIQQVFSEVLPRLQR